MSILEMQVEALMRLCTACDEETKMEAKKEIRRLLLGGKSAGGQDPEDILRQIPQDDEPVALYGVLFIPAGALADVLDADSVLRHLYSLLTFLL